MNFDRRTHWQEVYQLRAFNQVSWYQAKPATSLALIQNTRLPHDAAIIDVGGGASVLIDFLLREGFTDLTVLDISGAALNLAKDRLGEAATKVTWIEQDVTEFVGQKKYALWHDRAVFHFLTAAEDREKYINALKNALHPGGHAIIATFSTDGPTQCSGLDIVQYDEKKITAEFGDAFRLIETKLEAHITPAKNTQHFQYFVFEKNNQN